MRGVIRLSGIFVAALCCMAMSLAAQQTQWKRNIVVARDGTGDYRNLTEAMEGIRAFMDYKVTVFIKNGTYKEKVVIPSWIENVDFVGESARIPLSPMMTMPISIRWERSVLIP